MSHDAHICLYGRDRFGWLVSTADGRLAGDAELRHPGTVDAILCAVKELSAMGVTGIALVFAPGGRLEAEVSVEATADMSAAGWQKVYRSLKWRAARSWSFVLSDEDLVELAVEGRQ